MTIASTDAPREERTAPVPLVVSPAEACVMLDVSMAHLYKRVLPEVEVYKEGRATKIVVASLKRRQDRLVAERQGKRPRGRRRKSPPAPQTLVSA